MKKKEQQNSQSMGFKVDGLKQKLNTTFTTKMRPAQKGIGVAKRTAII